MLDILSKIGKEFNNENILWAVGASIMLNQYDLVMKPNDIDIIVDTGDIVKVDEIMQRLGHKKQKQNTDTYLTEYFYEYIVDGVDVDIMAGFIIKHKEGQYRYMFDKTSISRVVDIGDTKIPLTSLEDWYILYQLMPNRESKVELIEGYLSAHGIENKELLLRAIDGNITHEIENRTTKLIDKLEGNIK